MFNVSDLSWHQTSTNGRVLTSEWRNQSKHSCQVETTLTVCGPLDLSLESPHPTPEWQNHHTIIDVIILKTYGKCMTRHLRQLVTPAPDSEAGGSFCTWSKWSLAQGSLQSRTSRRHFSNPRTSLRCSLSPLHVEGLGRRSTGRKKMNQPGERWEKRWPEKTGKNKLCIHAKTLFSKYEKKKKNECVWYLNCSFLFHSKWLKQEVDDLFVCISVSPQPLSLCRPCLFHWYSQCTTRLFLILRGLCDVGCHTRQSSFMPFMALSGCSE